MTDRYRNRLSEYLDGELTADERSLVERHLEACEACATTLRELEAVVARAGDLPTREPPAGVWAGIARRLGEPNEIEGEPRRAAGVRRGRRRIAFSVPQLAAAAVTLAALSAGVARMASSPEPTDGAAVTQMVSDGSGDAALAADADLGLAEYYAGEIAALESALFDPARPLPPATEARVRRALETIDRALEDARQALQEAPDDPYLRAHVAGTLQRKSDFLRQALMVAGQS